MENKLNDVSFWSQTLDTYLRFGEVLICRVCYEFETEWLNFQKEIRLLGEEFIKSQPTFAKMGEVSLFSRIGVSNAQARTQRIEFIVWNIKRCLKNESHK